MSDSPFNFAPLGDQRDHHEHYTAGQRLNVEIGRLRQRESMLEAQIPPPSSSTVVTLITAVVATRWICADLAVALPIQGAIVVGFAVLFTGSAELVRRES